MHGDIWMAAWRIQTDPQKEASLATTVSKLQRMNGTDRPSSCARVLLVCTNLASRLNIPGLTGVPETESISSSSRSSSPMLRITLNGLSLGLNS
ncbi:hypothetical protein EYF80_004574 [Liparis tanakae]|uniref:Uncharacterized protein n=1 Tax=Liparis tanakae TaxID=230148 RepID=A0A4Z2J5S9_9TELE|nr:hypothetical protein EYF80_004574 [Liparis tanakae]